MKLIITIISVGISSSLLAQSNIEGLRECELETIDGMNIYTIVEESPKYEGGLTKFYREFSQNVKLPKSDSTNYHHTKYYVSFVIDTVGNIRNFCATPNLKESVNDNLVEKINKWTPGVQKGRKVPVRMVLPINIRLDKK